MDTEKSNKFVGEEKLKLEDEEINVNQQEAVHKNPFQYMKIDDNKYLNDINGRSPCIKCHKSRKFFCYTCYLPVVDLESKLPKVNLPVQIDIIKHRKEIDGKSTAIHAAILASNNVRIYTYPEIPDYSIQKDTVLIYPTHNSVHVDGLFDEHLRLQTADELKLKKGVNRGTLLKFKLNEVINGENASELKQPPLFTLENLPVKIVYRNSGVIRREAPDGF